MPEVLAEATVVVTGKVDPNIGKDAEESVGGITNALDNVEASSKKAKLGFRDLGKGVSDLGDGLAATGVVSQDTADKFALVGDGVAGAKGAFTALKGAASLASSGVGAVVTTMTEFPPVAKAMTVAQKALNIVMRANPIGLVVTALLLLGAGLVLAYKKSTTFRNIVNGAFKSIKAVAVPVFGFITKYIQLQIKIWTALFGGVKKVLGGIWSGVSGAAKIAFGGLLSVLRPIAKVINALISGANAASLGKLHIPHIPKFARGVSNFRGGLAVVGDQGPELLSLPKGSSVASNSDTKRMLGERGSNLTINQVFNGPMSGADMRRELEWLMRFTPRFGTAV